MSNFTKTTKNPDTGEWEKAFWIDDYYGNHHYGVRFEDGTVVDPDLIKLETKNNGEI